LPPELERDGRVGREEVVGDGRPLGASMPPRVIAPLDADAEAAVVEDRLDESAPGTTDVEQADFPGGDVLEQLAIEAVARGIVLGRPVRLHVIRAIVCDRLIGLDPQDFHQLIPRRGSLSKFNNAIQFLEIPASRPPGSVWDAAPGSRPRMRYLDVLDRPRSSSFNSDRIGLADASSITFLISAGSLRRS